jgi:hypothetical protein
MNNKSPLPVATFTARRWPWLVSQGVCVVALAGLTSRTVVAWGQLGEQARLVHLGGIVFLLFLAIVLFLLSRQQSQRGFKLVEIYPDRAVFFKYGWPGERVVLPRDQIASISKSDVQYDTDAVDLIIELKTTDSSDLLYSKVWSRISPPSCYYTYANGKVHGDHVVEELARWVAKGHGTQC